MDILTERQQVVQRLIDLTTGSDTEKIMQMIMNLLKVADYFENKTCDSEHSSPHRATY